MMQNILSVKSKAADLTNNSGIYFIRLFMLMCKCMNSVFMMFWICLDKGLFLIVLIYLKVAHNTYYLMFY